MFGDTWSIFGVGQPIFDPMGGSIIQWYLDPNYLPAYPYGVPAGYGTVQNVLPTARYGPLQNKCAELLPGEAFAYTEQGFFGSFEPMNAYAGFCLAFTAYVPAGFHNNPAYPINSWHFLLSFGAGDWREFTIGYDPGNGLTIQYFDPSIGPGFWSAVVVPASITTDWFRFFFYYTPDSNGDLAPTASDVFAVTTDAGNPAQPITESINPNYESGIQTGINPKLTVPPFAKPMIVFYNDGANPDAMWIGEWALLHGLRVFPRATAMPRPPSQRS